MSKTPPFRADHVGSFLRPAAVMEARQRRGDDEISAEDLREVEDEAIADVVRRQEDVGLHGITDGEFRRFMFHLDFLEQLDGVTVSEGDFLARFRRDDGTEVEFSPPKMSVTGTIGHAESIQGDVAEILLNEMKVDGFFLEYDDERSGDFAPLRHLPAGKQVVLGLMSSKHARVEDADEVKARIDEASEFAPLEQLALSHQCGFSSTAHGNTIEPDDQWRKLEQAVAIATDVWG